MLQDWNAAVGIFAGIATVVTFALYLRERRTAQRERDRMVGFLRGLSVQADGLATAGEQWQHSVGVHGVKTDLAVAYANAATNGWISLRRELDRFETELESSLRRALR